MRITKILRSSDFPLSPQFKKGLKHTQNRYSQQLCLQRSTTREWRLNASVIDLGSLLFSSHSTTSSAELDERHDQTRTGQ